MKHENLPEMLRNLLLEVKDLRIIQKLYWNQRAAVRQGCVLSLDLFNIYSKVILKELEATAGVRGGGKILTN